MRHPARTPKSPVALVIAIAQRPSARREITPIRQEHEVTIPGGQSESERVFDESAREIRRPGRGLYVEASGAVGEEEASGAP